MTLQEAVASTSEPGRSPLANDIMACKRAWEWLQESTVSGKIKRGDYFFVSLEDFPKFCKSALTHSLIILPHRDSHRYGNLASELIVAAQALEEDVSADSLATLLFKLLRRERVREIYPVIKPSYLSGE